MTNKAHRLLRKAICHLGSSEQRWPLLVALLGIGGLYAALPKGLIPNQDLRFRWIPMVVVLIAALPLVLSHRLRMHRINSNTAYLLLGVLTTFMVVSLWLVVRSVTPSGPYIPPPQLLKSAAILWCTNVLVFSCWYWRLDAGGPHARAARMRHEQGAILFPQMTMSPEMLEMTGQEAWKPGFIDYVFVAFNTSTALSPTDAPILTKWAKTLMMLQAAISITIVVLLAARAINILPQKQKPDPATKPPEIQRAATPNDATKTLSPLTPRPSQGTIPNLAAA